MAWPSTPLTTYLSGGLPFVKAFDLNAIQEAINGIINGTFSLHSVVVDGVGGVVVAGTAGTIGLSAEASGDGPGPTGTAIFGKLYKESGLFGAAEVNGGSGAFRGGFNVFSSVKNVGLGDYTVTFNGQPANLARVTGQVTSTNAAGTCFTGQIDNFAIVAGNLTAQVFMFDAAGAKADAWFFINVWGG